MIYTSLNKLLSVLCLLFVSLTIFGQGWERIYFQPDGTLEYSYSAANKVFCDGDSSYLFAATVNDEPKFLRTDTDGLITNLTNVPNVNGTLMRSSDDNFVYAARLNSSGPPEEDVVVTKYDASGNEIWSYRPTGYLFGNEAVSDLIEVSTGGYVIVGGQVNLSPQDLKPYITKIAENGDVLWKTVGGSLPEVNLYNYSVVELPDGRFFMISSSFWFTPTNPLITDVRIINGNGNLDWFGELEDDIQVRQILLATDGNIVLLGRTPDYDYTLTKIDATGNTIWQEVYSAAEYPFGYVTGLIQTADGGYAFLGNSQGVDEEDIYLVKTDAAGLVQWSQTYGGAFGDSGNDLKQLSDGGYLIAGGGNLQLEDQSLYIIRTDELGNSVANNIYGQVRYDLDEDCLVEADEQGLEDWIVAAAGSTGTFYGSVDGNGDYRIEVGAGDYTVTVEHPNTYWNACVNDVPVMVVDSSEVDFAVQSIDQCPLMEVTVYNFNYRLCEEGTINVLVRNQGTILAEDVYVEVTLADSLTLVDATVPFFLLADNTYTFELGDMDFLTSTTFSITTQVGCDLSLMGQTLCVEALVFPDTTCLPPDPAWSGASVELSASCTDEEVLLKIENVGEEAMVQELQYTIIEDHVIMLQDVPYGPLAPGEAIELPKMADGTFYRIESQQVPGHPGISMPSAFIEACGAGVAGEVSLGFVNQYPLDDADFYEDVSCTEVRAAYDPNIKEAFPIGYETEHFIRANTRIDYVIQFQNTGTDVANKVVLVDRLAAELDPRTIRPGVSSHEYDFELSGAGIVQFTFNNIQLLDSTTNEPESHGYVSFSIEQQRDLPVGTVIENEAAIYFDFNPAIITNTTFHTIGDGFITVNIGEVVQPEVDVVVYPNPFHASATLEVAGDYTGNLELRLFDVTGRLLRRTSFTDGEIVLERNGLPAGSYFYRIQDERGLINTGKLIVQ